MSMSPPSQLAAPPGAAPGPDGLPPAAEWPRRPRLVSVVAPVFREEAGIGHFGDAVVGVMRGLGLPFEIIFIEDDSPDGTWEELRRLHRRYPEAVRALALSRRFGHQA